MAETGIAKRVRTGTCAVLGMGISNTPLVERLLALGATVTVRDRKSPEELGGEALRFAKAGVRFVTGKDYLDEIKEEVIFRSPGIRPDAGSIPQAVARGAMLTSEMEWFLEETPATVIGVTGSDGKTTTTTLTYLMLKAGGESRGRGKTYVGGNIGTPLLPLAGEMTKEDFAVVELSSFQLMTLQWPLARAAITNLSPNHLNWHTDFAEYRDAKCHIFRQMCAGGRLVLNAENPTDREIGTGDLPAGIRVVWFSSRATEYRAAAVTAGADAVFVRNGRMIYADRERETEVLAVSDIRLPGVHNLENYMTAVALTWGDVPLDAIRKIAREFGGVEHRLELIRELGGIRYYNSSIDSSPSRTAAALSAMTCRPAVICGGRDKHVPFAPLADALAGRAGAVILTGEARDQILAAIEACPAFDRKRIPVSVCPAFGDAVQKAREEAERLGLQAVLLSPACTSFDAFRNFAERGDTFRRMVLNWKEGKEQP